MASGTRNGIIAALIVICFYVAFSLREVIHVNRVFGVKDERIVQILESPDQHYKAELVYRQASLDLNFIIHLNNQEIYISPDFDPNYTVPFRETLLWDKTGQNLIFEVAGRRLFGYNMGSAKRLSETDLLKLTVEPVRLETFGYEGNWPSSR